MSYYRRPGHICNCTSLTVHCIDSSCNDLLCITVSILFVHRVMSFDLQIAGTLFNGTCTPLNTGNVVLSYRIGTSRQWKVIEEYSSVGKHCYRVNYRRKRGVIDRVGGFRPGCSNYAGLILGIIGTCGNQKLWQYFEVIIKL